MQKSAFNTKDSYQLESNKKVRFYRNEEEQKGMWWQLDSLCSFSWKCILPHLHGKKYQHYITVRNSKQMILLQVCSNYYFFLSVHQCMVFANTSHPCENVLIQFVVACFSLVRICTWGCDLRGEVQTFLSLQRMLNWVR